MVVDKNKNKGDGGGAKSKEEQRTCWVWTRILGFLRLLVELVFYKLKSDDWTD